MASPESPKRPVLPLWAGELLAVLAVIAPALLPTPRPHAPGPPLAILVPWGIVAAAALLTLLRRSAPLPVFVTTVVLYCASSLYAPASTSMGVAAVLAAYSVGSRTGRRSTLIAGTLGTAAVAILSVTASDFGIVDPRVFQVAAGIAVAAALGDSARSRREFVKAATERAERAEQTREAETQQRVAEERLRIARDLHDTVAHQISVISLNAGIASGAMDANPAKARSALGIIRTAARGALSDIGDLLRFLRTDADELADSAPQPGLTDLPTLVRRVEEAGLRVDLRQTAAAAAVTGSPSLVAYRVIQEALTNAHKHGSGRSATVTVDAGADALTIIVTNPVSAGGRNQAAPPRGGLGLTGIRERVAAVRGTVTAEENAGSFVLTATLPLRRQEPA